MRRTLIVAAVVVGAMALWTASVRLRIWQVERQLAKCQTERKQFGEAITHALKLGQQCLQAEHTVAALEQHATNRLLIAPVLNALQQTALEEVQMWRLALEEKITSLAATKGATNNGIVIRAKPAASVQSAALTLQVKNFGDADAREQFIEKLSSAEYFKRQLRTEAPVTLKSLLPRQADPVEPSRTFSLFTLECRYPEKVVGYE